MKRKKNVRKPGKPIDKTKDDLVVNEDAVPYVTKSNKKQKEDEGEYLAEEQEAGLDKAFEEMENGEYATMADFKKAVGRWLIK